LLRDAEVIVPGTVRAGTVTATRGSDLITGDATAVAAWTNDLVGRVIRVRRSWYRITNVDTGASQVRIDAPFAEDGAAGVSYDIAADRVALPEDVRYLGQAVFQRFGRPLTVLSIGDLNRLHPERLIVGGVGPVFIVEVNGKEYTPKMVEFYPYPLEDEVVRFTYYADPAPLRAGDLVPQTLDFEALKLGVLVDVYRELAAKAAKGGNVELAGFYRNESNATETKWNRRIEELFAADHAQDDIATTLHTRGPTHYHHDDPINDNAHTDALLRFTDFPRV
jgi:hypothetical protein